DARRRKGRELRDGAGPVGLRGACYDRFESDTSKEAVRMKKYQLMAPGPTPVPSEVLLAMAEPIIHHRTPQYDAVFIEIRAGLKRLVQTSAEVVPLACSGTGAMEAAVVNTLPAGGKGGGVAAGGLGGRGRDL